MIQQKMAASGAVDAQHNNCTRMKTPLEKKEPQPCGNRFRYTLRK